MSQSFGIIDTIIMLPSVFIVNKKVSSILFCVIIEKHIYRLTR